MSNQLHARQQGIALIEAMIAAVILAVAILGLTRIQVGTLSDSGLSRVNTQALNAASDKIEELRYFSTQATYLNMAGGSDSVSTPGATLTRTWTVNNCPNSATCKEVSVAVEWTDTTGEDREVLLTSYISEDDPVRGGIALLFALE